MLKRHIPSALLAKYAFIATPKQLKANHITYIIFIKCLSTEADANLNVSFQLKLHIQGLHQVLYFLSTCISCIKHGVLMITKVMYHWIIIVQLWSLKAFLPTITILQLRNLMPDTSLRLMRVNSGCLLLHQKSNADPMGKAKAKSAF